MKKQRAFTLIELLVSISIIAILTALLLPNFMGARERARDASKKQGLLSVKNALRMYYNDNQGYPDTGTMAVINLLLVGYLPSISGIGYTYTMTNNNDGFQLCVGLESGAGDDVVESRSNCVYNGQLCGLPIATIDPKLFVVCAN